jgi:hypothetical protein
MRACIALFAPVVCASVALTISSGVVPDSIARAAPECLAKPGAAPPEGKHWYYQTDRATKRRCWYLGSRGENVHRDPRIASERPAARAKAPPRTIEDIVRNLNAETSARATAGEATSDDRLPGRAADQPVPTESIERDPTVTRDAAVDEPAKAGSAQNGMPSVWPSLTVANAESTVPLPATSEQSTAMTAQAPAETEQAAAAPEQPPASSGVTWYVLVLLFGAFAFAAVAYHRAAARRIAERLDLERKLAATSEIPMRPTPQSTFAAEVGHWAEIARRQPLPGDDGFRDTEDAVHSLLRASHARHHERAA